MRLFVAAEVPEAVQRAVAAIERPAGHDVRWSDAGVWHVTLRFLGEVDETDGLARCAAALRAVTCPGAVAVLGRTPRRLGPTAVVLPVEGLDPLAAAVTGAFAGLPGEASLRGSNADASLRGSNAMPACVARTRMRDGGRSPGTSPSAGCGGPGAGHTPVSGPWRPRSPGRSRRSPWFAATWAGGRPGTRSWRARGSTRWVEPLLGVAVAGGGKPAACRWGIGGVRRLSGGLAGRRLDDGPVGGLEGDGMAGLLGTVAELAQRPLPAEGTRQPRQGGVGPVGRGVGGVVMRAVERRIAREI